MELTRRNRNTQAFDSARGNSLATWGPLISRVTKMAIEYAKSGASKEGSIPRGGRPIVGTQYSRASTKRRGARGKRSLDREGIPPALNSKLQTLTITGSSLIQATNGAASKKWLIGNLSDAGLDLLSNNGVPSPTLAFMKAFGQWKYHRVSVKFETCLAATDGGYHSAVMRSSLDTTATVTPFYIGSCAGSKMQSVRSPIELSLVPSFNHGIVQYATNGETGLDNNDNNSGTIMYYCAGGPIAGNQPMTVLTFSCLVSVWNN